MIEEYTWHNGHAGLLRERIDGAGYWSGMRGARPAVSGFPDGRA
jgi:hypothetical protein